ncbi:DUF6233 domain-containing protein [Streptomyces venezuelae]|uniref:DUF6233 domain-containing protein n=1 Tax=Streptomyces venezuelae TaxID=54571 RepID=UPI0037B2A313
MPPAQRVDLDHRRIDSCLPQAAQLCTHLRLVPGLDHHFPLPRVRSGACGAPSAFGGAAPFPLPLPRHEARRALSEETRACAHCRPDAVL